MLVLRGQLSDIGLDVLGFVSPGEGPADVAGCVPNMGPNGEVASLFIIRKGLQDDRND